MAERKSKSGGKSQSGGDKSKSGGGGGKSKSGGAGSRGSENHRSPREIALSAAKQAQELIGRPVESITGMSKDGDGWTITLEVLELERVPTTTDVLGKYEVTLDKNGELTGAERTRRYPRAEAGEV